MLKSKLKPTFPIMHAKVEIDGQITSKSKLITRSLLGTTSPGHRMPAPVTHPQHFTLPVTPILESHRKTPSKSLTTLPRDNSLRSQKSLRRQFPAEPQLPEGPQLPSVPQISAETTPHGITTSRGATTPQGSPTNSIVGRQNHSLHNH